MRIQLLGRFGLVCGERTIETAKSPRLESLLAYLVLHPGAPQPRRRLSSLFWPDSDESQARTNLRQLLHNLRHTVPEADRFLDSDSANLSFRADAPFELDVAEFERAVERARALRSEDPSGERAALEEAARLYTGDLLPDVYDEWAEPLREGLRRKCLEALHRLVSLFEREGDPGGALAYAERMVKQDPLDEESYRQLMRLYALKGDRAGALRVYHRCETALRRELDVEPDKETRELRERLKNVSPAEELPRSDGPQTLADQMPLVGRKREWAQLLEAWRSADSGHASLALISGEAGIGKTRLSEELLATASRQGIATGRARCYAAEGSLAYAPIADWLRSDALRPALAALHPAQLSELSRILPELTVERPEVPPPEPLAEGWQRQRFFDTLSRVFLQVRPPLLLLLDDVQWCDRESIEWLHHLLRVDPRARLLVVGTERVEETSADHPAKKLLTELQRSERLTSIELGPLDAGETIRLASHVLSRELDPERAADLYRETEGNPFFVVESMRAALETKSIPPRVRAVLSARLAQLSPMAHELVGLAATVGRSFSFEVLSLSSGHDEDRLVRALDELWQRRIVRAQGAQEYDFTHDKLRELAYAELAPGRQSLLHRRVARGLEKRFASDLDPWASAIATHYHKAGSAGLAIPFYERAARWAQTLYAHPEAVGYLTAARELLSKLTDVREREEFELSILVSLAASLRVLHGYTASELGPVYARARELSGRIARPTQNVAVLWGAWLFH
ncbi:MAG TPA: BTAD domain-containing putative transcriptional regulator, partial [Vicinamibacteria bacterium]